MATATNRKSAAATNAAPAKPAPSGPLPTLRIVPNTSGPAAVIALIDQAGAGLTASSLCELGQRLELPVRELATLLGTTERTLAWRFHINDELTKAESERLLLLQRLVVHGVDVFEDQGKFNRWLRLPLPLLDGQSPLQLLDTASGFQVVDELLGHIEYSVYS
jgi:putative toxin-antitoxin system antitoxin component (TIGR02293 family)